MPPRPAPASTRSRPSSQLSTAACAAGILEISAWNQANALRQVTVKRGLDVRDFVLTTFGGSGSLLACRLIDILGLKAVLVPPNPGNVSAFGLLTVDVKNDYVQTWVRSERELDPAEAEAAFGRLRDAGRCGAGGRRLRRGRSSLRPQRRPALLRPGVRGAGAGRRRRAQRRHRGRRDRRISRRASRALRLRLPRRPGPAVEWVNLRVSGIGPIQRPELRELDRARRARRPNRAIGRSASTATATRPAKIYQRTDLAAGDVVTGPAVVEEFGSTVPIHPGFAARVDRFGNLLIVNGTMHRYDR